LLVIVPDNVGLELEAQVLNRDIGFVRTGQPVEIKVDAFPYTHYGTFDGTVESISQDAVLDDKLGLIYPARIRLTTTRMVAHGESFSVTSGMSAEVEIKTTQQRIIEYLLAPLQTRVSSGLKER
jgi:hemolysin D